jgi:hypothetical protein
MRGGALPGIVTSGTTRELSCSRLYQRIAARKVFRSCRAVWSEMLRPRTTCPVRHVTYLRQLPPVMCSSFFLTTMLKLALPYPRGIDVNTNASRSP